MPTMGGYKPEDGGYKRIYWYCPVCGVVLDEETASYSRESMEAHGFEPNEHSTPENPMADAYRLCGTHWTAAEILQDAPALAKYMLDKYDRHFTTTDAIHAIAAGQLYNRLAEGVVALSRPAHIIPRPEDREEFDPE